MRTRRFLLPLFVSVVVSIVGPDPVTHAQDSAATTSDSQSASQTAEDLSVFGVKLTDVLLLTLTASALVLTWAITIYQWKLARKQNTVQLHADYYSIDHYANVVSPTAQVRLKWLFLPDKAQRAQYRAAVVAGWAPAALELEEDAGYTKFKLYVREKNLDTDTTATHFHLPVTGRGLSEHQALAAFLHFWSRLAGLLAANAIDRKVVKELFAPAYDYNRDFFRDLCRDVEASLREDPKPAWLAHLAYLQKVFT